MESKEMKITREEIFAIEQAAEEFGFSTEPGGINEDNPEASRQLELLSNLISRWHQD